MRDMDDEDSIEAPSRGAATVASDRADVLIARQPIFDERQAVFGHELLYRGPRITSGGAGMIATARVLYEALGEIGLDRIVQDGRVFINFDEPLLVSGAAGILPGARAVIEVLEDVAAGPAVLESLAKLKRELGVGVALDDFAFQEHALGLLPLADFIKVDVLEHCERLDELVARLRPSAIPLIAEKVETREVHARCRALGFRYFQGYFFARPECLDAQPPSANQLVLLRLLAELERPDSTPQHIARAIGRDARLVHQVLKLANSAHHRRRRTLTSVADAVVVLGLHTLRRWLSILLLARLGQGKPSALLELALTRATLCERLSECMRVESSVAFTAGILSVLDALLDRPMTTIIASLELSQELSAALLGDRSAPLGRLLGRVMDFERGRWIGWGPETPIDAGHIMEAYLSVLELVRSMLEPRPV